MESSARERPSDVARAHVERAPDARDRLVCAVADARPISASAAASALRSASLGEGGAASFDALRGLASPSFVWVPREGRGEEDTWSFVGWGVAARVDGAGAHRFDDARARAEAVWGRVERAAALPVPPRLFGGFAFGDEGPRSSASPGATSPHASAAAEIARAWEPFGDACFLLPRLLFGRSGERAFIAAFTQDASASASLVDAARRALDVSPPRFTDAPLRGGDRRASRAPVFESGDERAWIELVTSALAEIERRTFGKVVLCRTRRVSFPSRPDLLRALGVLEARHPACARFLFELGGSTFLGASPERLIAVRSQRAVTEALAGSLPRRAGEVDDDARARLLATEKERAEHAFVVDAIRAALSPVSDALAIPPAPEVRTLPHLHHLATPITALLRDRVHALDIARRLHPTPALCGAPRAEARAFLLSAEAQPRGWYGGGVGWFDATGDGSFAVAIRSALAARESAFIYAGAGIVGASDPVSEYEETTIKESAMREALEVAA